MVDICLSIFFCVFRGDCSLEIYPDFKIFFNYFSITFKIKVTDENLECNLINNLMVFLIFARVTTIKVYH